MRTTADMRCKLVVIDDIKSTVEMIATKIPWDAYGIEVVGTAKNGQEGLSLIRETRPDLILTDIRMPKMDGLEMTRQIINLLPQCKIIILSAYTDFEYAKQAIRLGAFDFVKKPFSIQEITKVVLEAKQALVEAYNQHQRIQSMEKKVQESLPLLRQEYFSRLLQHGARPEEVQSYWDELHVDMHPEGLAVMVIEIDHFMEKYASQPVHEIELVRFALHNILEETIQSATRGVVFRDGPSYYACIVNCGSPGEARQLAEACCANIADCTRFTISIGIGGCVRDLHELPDSYKSALSALAYHFYTGGNGALSFADVPKEREAAPRYAQDKEQELLHSLRAGNGEKALRELERFFEEMKGWTPLPDPHDIRSLYYELALLMLRVFYESVPVEVLQPYDRRLRDRSSQELDSLRAFQQLLMELCSAGCAWIEKERAGDATQLIYRAVDYIRSHLHVDLTVEHCAKQINISGGAFCQPVQKGDRHHLQSVRHGRTDREGEAAADRKLSGAGDCPGFGLRAPALFQRGVQEAHRPDTFGIQGSLFRAEMMDFCPSSWFCRMLSNGFIPYNKTQEEVLRIR